MKILSRRFHPTNRTGNMGEDVALRFLRSKGYSILERNYRNARGKALGEIDIVAREGNELVFVEVKSRVVSRGRIGILPEEAITAGKLRKLARIAEGYVRERRCDGAPYRFDAVTVLFPSDDADPEIRHLRSIFL